MTLKWQILVSLAATLSFFTVSYPYRSVDAGPAGPVLQATGPAGVVFLDTGNGTISYCTNPVDTNPTPVAPLGNDQQHPLRRHTRCPSCTPRRVSTNVVRPLRLSGTCATCLRVSV